MNLRKDHSCEFLLEWADSLGLASIGNELCESEWLNWFRIGVITLHDGYLGS